VFRAYRTHPHHYAVYGPDGISQTLLGQWLGLRQPQVSRIETGPPIRDLGTLAYWARVLRIPSRLLWFRLPEETRPLAVAERAGSDLEVCRSSGALIVPAGWQSQGVQSGSYPSDPDHDPVLAAPWNHRGTVEAVVVLSGGGRVKRRVFLSLTAPAHAPVAGA
jgi:hypothetical protein